MEEQVSDADAAVFRDFHDRCVSAFRRLFGLARDNEEVPYALSLSPEMRGSRDPGWNTALEAKHTLDDYIQLLQLAPAGSSMRVRVGLSLYSHLSEAAGFYEVPKNMMRIAGGEDFNLWPCSGLVEKHAASGARIAPNATKVMKDLLGHAGSLGLDDFQAIILETFDFDLRNGYAHADYVVWDDGVRLPKRNGGQPRVVPFSELTLKVNKSISLFTALNDTVAESMQEYAVPKRTSGRINSRNPVMPAIISYSDEGFSIKLGFGL